MSESPYRPRFGRRELLRLWGPSVLAGAALAGVGGSLLGRAGRHRPKTPEIAAKPRDWRIATDEPGKLAIAGGGGPADNLGRAVAAMGGLERFIKPGERVALKPNCAWDRTAEQAANTNPDLIAALVTLCLEAGAGSVTVVDNSCHDPDRVFARSGIAAAARQAGAAVAHQNTTGTVALDLGGTVLGVWEVLKPIAEADRLINVPIVKHHSLPHVTLGMKNWFGAIVGRRNSLHQRIHEVCAELGAAFRATLTVVDATRVLTAGGPTGGSLDLVRAVDQVAVSTDPVAADTWGCTLFDIRPEEIRYLAIAERLGLGTTKWADLQVEA
jgi:uncharacterized protein (DUF362 family)